MSNLIPDGWAVQQLDRHLDILSGCPFKSALFTDDNTKIGLIRIRDLAKQKMNTFYNGDFDNLFVIKKGDILIGMDGDFNIVKWKTKDALLNQRICKIKASYNSNFDTDFLFHSLEPELQTINASTAATTVKHLSVKDIRGIERAYPPLKEQQKIAAILTSVDEVIEKTQAQIDKLKDLKKGMMQELLTRGVGVDGKPHTKFKDSPVGRIPKGWDVQPLGKLASFVTSGSRGWAQYYSESGAIFIRIGNLTRDHINFRFKDTIYVTPPNSAEGKRTLVQTGDVLISITADLGVIAVVNDDIGKAYVNQHVSLVRLNNIDISRWVGHFLSFEESQKQFTANNDSGAKAGLNLTAIRNTQVALPPIKEMNQIIKALDSIDSSIAMKRTKLAKITDTKKALMQDLLTGKVRVKVDS
jgi:type I restriction enzyme S subunit